MDVLTLVVIALLLAGLVFARGREAGRRRRGTRDRAMRQLKELNDAATDRRETVHFPPRHLPTLDDFRARAHRGPQ
jgi:hypothetical protein